VLEELTAHPFSKERSGPRKFGDYRVVELEKLAVRQACHIQFRWQQLATGSKG